VGARDSTGNDKETKAKESVGTVVFFDIEEKQTPLIISKLF
jgi:hypothetical protein